MKIEDINKDHLSELTEFLTQPIGDNIPVIGKILTSIKMIKLNNRIKLHEDRIRELLIYASNTAAKEFFLINVAPICLEKIIQEHEEDKIDLFLNGFENCIKNEITEMDKILFYFDILSNLRLLELKRLFEHSKVVNVEPLKIEENTEEAMILKDIDLKLHNDQIIGFPEFMGVPELSEPATLSKKGEYLLKFIGYK